MKRRAVNGAMFEDRRGDKNANARTSRSDVIQMRRMFKAGATRKEIYAAFPGTSPRQIRDIVSGRSWADVQ